NAIMAAARAHGLRVVEDAACALGSEMQFDGSWRRVGHPAGDVACFSLHPRKVVTVGDGGVLTTQDAALDARFRLLRQHGMTVPDTVRRGIMCIHREKPYAETVRFPLPISEDAQDRTILLPLYPQMTEPEQDQVIGALQEVLRHRTAGGSSGRVAYMPTAKTTKGDDSFRRSYERGGT